MAIRLVASDLDGTLLHSDGTISARSVRALEAVRAAGLALVFVTARPPRGVPWLAREAGVGGLAICSNGALIYDLNTERVVEERPLDGDTTTGLVLELRRRLAAVAFACEARLQFCREPHFVSAEALPPDQVLIADALDFARMPVAKLMVRHPQSSPEALFAAVTTAAAGRVAIIGPADLIEISRAGVTKQSTLTELCARLGVAADEVIAFGDMPNDLGMLMWAGRGVAVANADPEVLAAAGEVTASNDADGVALVLETLAQSG
ncbi:MAG: Cof-type HAD-IIB family hydrolase [Thermoleophilia bacterium]